MVEFDRSVTTLSVLVVCCGLRLAVDLSVKTFRRCLLADAVGYISGELAAVITTLSIINVEMVLTCTIQYHLTGL